MESRNRTHLTLESNGKCSAFVGWLRRRSILDMLTSRHVDKSDIFCKFLPIRLHINPNLAKHQAFWLVNRMICPLNQASPRCVCALKLSLCLRQYVLRLRCNECVMINQLAFSLTHSQHTKRKGGSAYFLRQLVRHHSTDACCTRSGTEQRNMLQNKQNTSVFVLLVLRTRAITGNTFGLKVFSRSFRGLPVSGGPAVIKNMFSSMDR